jgi:hypothetical protein
MTMTMLKYAAIAAVGGTLAFAPLSGSMAQLHSGARAAVTIAQYCLPPEDAGDVPRLYCRERG